MTGYDFCLLLKTASMTMYSDELLLEFPECEDNVLAECPHSSHDSEVCEDLLLFFCILLPCIEGRG